MINGYVRQAALLIPRLLQLVLVPDMGALREQLAYMRGRQDLILLRLEELGKAIHRR